MEGIGDWIKFKCVYSTPIVQIETKHRIHQNLWMLFSAYDITDISEFSLISLTYSQECALYMWSYGDGDGNEGSGPVV